MGYMPPPMGYCVTLVQDYAIFTSFKANSRALFPALHVLPVIFSCEKRKSLSFYDILSLSLEFAASGITFHGNNPLEQREAQP